MESIKGTKTEELLAASYIAESCAYSRYTFFGKAARKEGYYQYANIFDETADNELHHAKIFLNFLTEAGAKSPAMSIDAGIIASTAENLRVAAHEEEVEGVEFYTNAAKVADSEGFPAIAAKFRLIATIEEHHRRRFEKMERRIAEEKVWKSDKPTKWQCEICGYIIEGTEPPVKCPVCLHPQQYFMRLDDENI